MHSRVSAMAPMPAHTAFPAKAEFDTPTNNLWVGNLVTGVTDSELTSLFGRYGKVNCVTSYPARNYAFVHFNSVEGALAAKEALQGALVRGNPLRIDFAKPEQGFDFPKEGQFPYRGVPHTPDYMKPYSEPYHAGSKRQHFEHQFLPIGGRRDGLPSKILCISYPPSAHIEEDMLHNAMILFGEIERIKTYDDRNYALVEFRSVEEAILAKEGLQGKLFSDPRISIEYSSSGFPPTREFFTHHPSQVGIFDHNLPLLHNNNIPGHLPLGIHGLDMLSRPLGPLTRLDHPIPVPEYPDLASMHKLQDSNPHNLMPGFDWGRSSPITGLRPPGLVKPQNRTEASSGWDVYDASASQLNRESKRSRIDSALALDERRPPTRVVPGHDYMWRGLIAKGGTPVCRARCVPIGDEIESEIPDIVNCSARTGLDMLTKHYADAIGFKIVFFLPDSEEDFSSYTEFLRYLGTKNRAGVAKFNDGTTLFLVPPSDFLRNVLNVSGPERLYGVVLEFPQITATSVPPPALHMDSHYNNTTPREDLQDKLPPKTVCPPPLYSAPPSINMSSPLQSGITLTPELIATLTSLLPVSSDTTASTVGPVLNNTSGGPPDQRPGPPHGWGYVQQTDFMNTQTQPLPPAQVFNGPPSHEVVGYNPNQNHEQHSFNFQVQTSASCNGLSSPNMVGPLHVGPHNPYGAPQSSHLQLQQQPNQPHLVLPNQQLQTYPVPPNQGMNPQPHESGAEGVMAPPQQQLYSGAGPESVESEESKNERYRKTLMFAANLLSQIHQQQPNAQSGQGS